MKKILTLSVLSYTLSAICADAMEIQSTENRSLKSPESHFIQNISELIRNNSSSSSSSFELFNLEPHDLPYSQDSSHVKAAKMIKLALMLGSFPYNKIGVSSQEQQSKWISQSLFFAGKYLANARENLPTAQYFVDKVSDLLPATVRDIIPAEIIVSVDLTPEDSFYEQSVKLRRLGSVILNLGEDQLGSQFYLQKALAAHCFMYAANKLEKWMEAEAITHESNADLYIEALTMAKQYYELAVENLNDRAAQLMRGKVQKLQGKIEGAQQHRLFKNLRSGFEDSVDRKYSTSAYYVDPSADESSSSESSMRDVINELKSGDHTGSVKLITNEERVNPVRHFFPESVLQYSDDILVEVGLQAHDSPYVQAFKISRLAMNIHYVEPQSKNRDQVISDCYNLAGDNLIKAIQLQREHVNKPLAPELLMDTAMSAAQFYIWAASKSSGNATEIYQKANNALQMTINAIIDIPEKHYDWRVISENTLREVILANLEKILKVCQV